MLAYAIEPLREKEHLDHIFLLLKVKVRVVFINIRIGWLSNRKPLIIPINDYVFFLLELFAQWILNKSKNYINLFCRKEFIRLISLIQAGCQFEIKIKFFSVPKNLLLFHFSNRIFKKNIYFGHQLAKSLKFVEKSILFPTSSIFCFGNTKAMKYTE